MYLFNIKTLKSEFEKYLPESSTILNKNLEDVIEEFDSLPREPFDTAVSEKSDKVIVFPADIDWSDIGSFDILSEILAKQKDANPKHVAIDSKNIFVHSANNYLVATLGIDDIIVVETNDSILVQKKGKSNEVRKVVEYLKEKNMSEVADYFEVHRPWGIYKILMEMPGYKVKRHILYPGGRFSVQSHKKRSEYWIVVKGVAEVTKDEEIIKLKPGESVDIPVETKHRLSNIEKENLEIIEVQLGDYLGEDDEIRFADDYNRA
jgi:mannose-1-phosphate guanylyltransferase/mannose-6-phosphate isomerase